MTRPAVARAAVGMGGATALSRGFGFLRVLVVAAILGTTYLGNTFQAANSVSNVLFELLAAGALSAVLVPTFVSALERGDDAEADRLASRLLGLALAVLGPITLVALFASPLIARVLSTGAPNAEIASEQRDLATFLLVFFLPQVLLYAFATIATGLLYARRQFAITAIAPIASSLVIIGCMVAFRVVAGPGAGLDLALGERLLLAAAGTGGVVAFAGVLVVAARRAGFSCVPRWGARDDAVRTLTRHSAWGVLLHANAGLLLGAALIAGNAVAGGVVAYQVAFVFFLAPYAVLAQPIHTTILPELAREADAGDRDAFAHSLRWALDRMALLVVPVSALLLAFSLPFMRVVSFGQAAETGPELLSAALAALGAGLLPYGALLLFARAFYALGDSRTPAVVAIASAIAGVGVIAVGAPLTHGTARVALLGAGHSAAYALGALVLGALLGHRTGHMPSARTLLLASACVAPLAGAGWLVLRVVDPQSRVASGVLSLGCSVLIAAAYGLVVRRRLRTIAEPS